MISASLEDRYGMTGLVLSGAHAHGRWEEEGIAAHGPTVLGPHEAGSEASLAKWWDP